MSNKYIKAVIAGIAIALSGWMYLLAPNQIIGAFLFSCGLLSVRIYGTNLFTGKIQYMVTEEYKWYDYPIFLLCNLFGVLLIAGLSRNLVQEVVIPIAEAKLAQPFLTSFIKGIGCGALMSLATYKKSPIWMCIPCVMGFILAGFNHCIADFYYLSVYGHLSWSFAATILGNIVGGIAFSNLILKDEQ